MEYDTENETIACLPNPLDHWVWVTSPSLAYLCNWSHDEVFGLAFGLLCILVWIVAHILWTVKRQRDFWCTSEHAVGPRIRDVIGDSCQLSGAILTHQLSTQVIFAAYHLLVALVFLLQYLCNWIILKTKGFPTRGEYSPLSQKGGEVSRRLKVIIPGLLLLTMCSPLSSGLWRHLEPVSEDTYSSAETHWRTRTLLEIEDSTPYQVELKTIIGYVLGTLYVIVLWTSMVPYALQVCNEKSLGELQQACHLVDIAGNSLYLAAVFMVHRDKNFLIHSLPWTLARSIRPSLPGSSPEVQDSSPDSWVPMRPLNNRYLKKLYSIAPTLDSSLSDSESTEFDQSESDRGLLSKPSGRKGARNIMKSTRIKSSPVKKITPVNKPIEDVKLELDWSSSENRYELDDDEIYQLLAAEDQIQHHKKIKSQAPPSSGPTARLSPSGSSRALQSSPPEGATIPKLQPPPVVGGVQLRTGHSTDFRNISANYRHPSEDSEVFWFDDEIPGVSLSGTDIDNLECGDISTIDR